MAKGEFLPAMTMIDRVLVTRPSGCLVRPGSYLIFGWSGCLNNYLRLFSPNQNGLHVSDGAALVASGQPQWMRRQKQAFITASILDPGRKDT